MKITEQNYAKYLKLFSIMTKWVKETPNVFNSRSLIVRYKINKFIRLNKALKDFDKLQWLKSESLNPNKRNVGNYETIIISKD